MGEEGGCVAWGKRREGGGCSTPAGGHRVWEGEACGLASPFAACRALVDRSRAFACSLRRRDERPPRASAPPSKRQQQQQRDDQQRKAARAQARESPAMY